MLNSPVLEATEALILNLQGEVYGTPLKYFSATRAGKQMDEPSTFSPLQIFRHQRPRKRSAS